MDQLIRLSSDGIARLRIAGGNTAFRICVRYVDILVVPWFLDFAQLWAYVLARLASLSVPLALFCLGSKLSPQLKQLANSEKKLPFKAAAARVNLGYLMVCGAVTLLVLSGAPLLARVSGVESPAFGPILAWMLIGQAAPILFGATGLLMQIVDRGAFHDLLLGMTAVLFIISIGMIDTADPVSIAQSFSVAQLSQAAICAILLTQCGVWPGLTALFHKQIKLF